ncbi:MAG TPA: iron ABC transporter permease [Candidatus Bathyarchaeota archaeon]|nr:iron ABC transporter permease [Candidatus Bathyarchaeota archaeon]
MSTATELAKLYSKSKSRKALAIMLLFGVLLLTIIISVSFGAGSPRFNEAFNVIFNKFFPFLDLDPGSTITQMIILELRLPRIALAIVAGAGLAASGAVMQGVLRNPLVSPYILGISSAAGFGAAMAIVFNLGVLIHYSNYLIVVNAFFFSFLAMMLVLGIARIRGISSETVILAGVTVSFLFSAMLSLIQFLAPEHEAVRAVVFWLLGSFQKASWESVFIIIPIVLFSVFLMMKQSWDLNVMSLGEDVATSLGVNSTRVMLSSMMLGSLATAAIISFTGVIGFIGLVSPHLARMLIGSDHRFLLPCCTVIGASLLLASDTVARTVMPPAEFPVGIITSLLGVPFFMYLLISRRRQNWG